jgi:DNA gyrase subunit A
MAEETIQPASIVEETRHRYLTYALSVITSRALPDVRDGLKPVQRRIIYTMFHELHLRSESRYMKCARIVGEVMGKYHPHGDAAIYDALVRMAQDFVMRMTLVDGQGNFGSITGDSPAHQRYTEAKLTPLADYLMTEFRQNTVDLRPTYDGQNQEPVVLPAQYPNLLVNGASGIAVGMATNIPPHNLGEVITACIMLIENPECTTTNLMKELKGPDFPLGGKVVTDKPTLRKIYEDGTGSIRVQGEWKLEETSKKRQLVITSIPYGVNKANLENTIGDIIASRKLPHITGMLDETNEKAGMRLTLDLKPDAEPEMVMAYLYKHTTLQENFAFNLTCLIPGPDGTPQPQRLGLKEVLHHFLDFRFATVKRRFEYELEQLLRRIHILTGFKIIFNDLDKAIRLIRESSGKSDACEKLMKVFKLDEEQATAILDAQLYRIAQMEIKRILDELREKKALAAEIEEILASKRKLWKVIKDEMGALAAKHSEDKRRTGIASGEDTPEFSEEAYIVKENTNVVLTRDGWIKRVGRLASIEGTRVREGDQVIAVAPASTLDHVIFLSDDGVAYTMRVNEIPASSGYGEPLAKFFRLGEQAKIVNAVTTDERFTPAHEKPPTKHDPAGPFLLAITAQGMSLRTPLAPYRTESTKAGRRYARLGQGDRIVFATVWRGEKHLFLASSEGRVLHFPVAEINILSGVGKGVIGIKLADDDTCLGGTLISDKVDRMQTETANGVIMDFRSEKYDVTSRAGKGFEAVKRTTFVRVVPPAIELVDWDELEGKKGPSRNGAAKGLFE